MQDVLSLILGGGRGTRLFPLTMLRSKPAVPIAGKYRLIDIPISNCINSGLNRVFVLTQFLSVSLHRHIANTYKFDPFSRGFVEVLAAQQTNEAADWYQGTADAVRQNIRYVHEDGCRDVLILSGDQIYRMDFHKLLHWHRHTEADVTIAVLPVSADQASNFGIVRLDDSGRVVGFVEKPKEPAELAKWRTPPEWIENRGIQSQGRQHLASMGIYLFTREALFNLLGAPPLATDFGKEIFPRSIQNHRVQAFLFDGYWEDVGTIKAYHEASLALTAPNPPFDFHSPEGVIYTRMRYLPAARVIDAHLNQCLIGDGCVVQPGTSIERCILGIRTQIGKNVKLTNSVIIGADRFETEAERAENRGRSIPILGVGDNSVIDNAILDKDCRVGANVRIVNKDKVQVGEGKNFVIREGIVVIPKGAVVLDGTVI
ncbi:MAG TPA: glucose-1-phosphate adenylyltransferase [Gemmataceae bacterium]|nr:glucose-1-phosphate adenylyltransferase [Gemmataceae bacterium]